MSSSTYGSKLAVLCLKCMLCWLGDARCSSSTEVSIMYCWIAVPREACAVAFRVWCFVLLHSLMTCSMSIGRNESCSPNAFVAAPHTSVPCMSTVAVSRNWPCAWRCCCGARVAQPENCAPVSARGHADTANDEAFVFALRTQALHPKDAGRDIQLFISRYGNTVTQALQTKHADTATVQLHDT